MEREIENLDHDKEENRYTDHKASINMTKEFKLPPEFLSITKHK